MSIFDHQLNQGQLDSLYNWVDSLPLSRPKKNISRDFSDAVLMAQTINYYYPKFVELHNYPSTNSIKSKISNWRTLSNKVLNKFGIFLKEDQCQKLASSTPMMVEILLNQFKKISVEQNRENEHTGGGNRELTHSYHNRGNQDHQQYAEAGSGNFNDEKGRKKQFDTRGIQVTKVEQLKQILKILREKISFVQKNIQRKDAQIKQLQDIIQLGI